MYLQTERHLSSCMVMVAFRFQFFRHFQSQIYCFAKFMGACTLCQVYGKFFFFFFFCKGIIRLLTYGTYYTLAVAWSTENCGTARWVRVFGLIRFNPFSNVFFFLGHAGEKTEWIRWLWSGRGMASCEQVCQRGLCCGSRGIQRRYDHFPRIQGSQVNETARFLIFFCQRTFDYRCCKSNTWAIWLCDYYCGCNWHAQGSLVFFFFFEKEYGSSCYCWLLIFTRTHTVRKVHIWTFVALGIRWGKCFGSIENSFFFLSSPFFSRRIQKISTSSTSQCVV